MYILAILLSCAWVTDAEWESRVGDLGCDTGCGGDPDDMDGDGHLAPEDCWDDPASTPADFVALGGFAQLGAADVHPGADDTWYDGVDADCDGAGDFDQDDDGYDASGWAQRDGSVGDDCYDAPDDAYPEHDSACQGDGDGLDPAEVYPGAEDAWYDGTDANCDGNDFDADGDTYDACQECDDSDAQIYPDDTITEVWYDGEDQNCDGDDGDQDGDGVYVEGYAFDVPDAFAEGDCWDDPASVPEGFDALNGMDQPSAWEVYPDAADAPYDGVPQDCEDDEGEYDVDGDGSRSDMYPDRDGLVGDDCDDADMDVYPGAGETWYTGVDENCDGGDDYDQDGDGDRHGDYGGADCDDTDETVSSLLSEDCGTTTVDDNCDGSYDQQNATNCFTWYYDGDGDTYGKASSSECWCEAQTARSFDQADDDDCDDADADTFPGAASTDSATACMNDDDGDGYGDDAPPAGVSAGQDCDDTSASDYPNATETVNNGDDEDCDGVDRCYTDADNDNYGTTSTVDSTDLDCNNSNMATVSTDCNDSNSSIYPGASDISGNGTDEDCDGGDG